MRGLILETLLSGVFPIKDEDNYTTLLELSYGECTKFYMKPLKKCNQELLLLQANTIHPIGFLLKKNGWR